MFKRSITMVMVLAMILGILMGVSGSMGSEGEQKANAHDWPRWRGPELNGISQETGWLGDWEDGQARIVWKASIGTGFSSMAVVNNRVFTMGNTAQRRGDANPRDVVYCLDGRTGKEIWKHEYACELGARSYKGGPHATPTVAGENVYTFSKYGHAFCLDGQTGKVKWGKNLQEELNIKPPTWGFASSATILGDLLLLNMGAGAVALDKASGDLKWRSGDKPSGYSTPLPFEAGGSEGIAFFTAEGMTAVEVETGKPLWLIPWKTDYDAPAADPIFVGDKVFISSGWGRGAGLFEIKGNKTTKIWEHKEMCNQNNSCVFREGYLYGFSGNQNSRRAFFRCLDFNTGEVKWEQDGMGVGSVMLADEKLIILSERGELVIAEVTPEGFKPLRRSQILDGTCWTVPVLANGKIYARSAEGDLVCVDVKGN